MRLISLVLLSFIGCAAQQQPSASPVPVTASACTSAQQNLSSLQCDNGHGGHLGDPTAKGKSWEQLCLDDASNGIDLNPTCITKAKSCTEVNSCLQ